MTTRYKQNGIFANQVVFQDKKNISSIAIGGFDGIHLAHQKLIENLDENGAILVIDKGNANLTPNENRKRFISCGLFFYKLKDIKHLTSKQFIELLKDDFPNLQKIVVGYDFHFGKNRSCNIECLKKSFKTVKVVDEVKIDNISVHSKEIRDLINSGEIKRAKQFLGRNYSIIGNQIRGQGVGKKELFATINIYVDKFLIPKNGVYASISTINNQNFNSITFIGIRETTDNNFSIETHLLDVKDIKLDKEIEIKFISFLRENKKFNSIKALKNQINNDIKKTKEIFENESFF